MSGDFLPEWINLFLDDFETSLCLPILVVVILCTAQFVFNHIFDVARVIHQNVRGPTAAEGMRNKNDIMGKLKGILSNLGGNRTCPATMQNPAPEVGRHSAEEEWDYCEDYRELE